VVPEHLLLSHMPWAKRLDTSFEVPASHRQLVMSLLDILCFEGDHMGPRTAQPLAEAFLQAVSESVVDHIDTSGPPASLADKRFADIHSCIQKHLTCADLTFDRVARYCGISPRYLCYVLKANNTSFSELLWNLRLPKARDWLICEAFQGYPIHTISRMAGFKSAAHFSRMFKAAYSVSPKEYRVNRAAEVSPAVDGGAPPRPEPRPGRRRPGSSGST
jgi:AraC-like DNA-binding protein